MNIENIQIEGVDPSDYPDFCDAYISYAEIDGKPATDEELDKLNENSDFVYSAVLEWIY
jgi:hypothetical protein